MLPSSENCCGLRGWSTSTAQAVAQPTICVANPKQLYPLTLSALILILGQTMTLSAQAALSTNLELDDTTVPGSPESLNNVDIQSDDENDREVVEKRLSRYYPTTPVSVAAIIRPQFSCPDFSMGAARETTGWMEEAAPPVPPISTIYSQPESSADKVSESIKISPTERVKVRKKSSFYQLDAGKRGWEDPFREEIEPPRKRHAMFRERRHGINLEPLNPYRHSRFLTSFDELFKPELPSSQRYTFKEERDVDNDSLRDKIKQGMEDSIIPSTQVTPVKNEHIPLKELIRGLMNNERQKRRKRGWLEKIVGRKRWQVKS